MRKVYIILMGVFMQTLYAQTETTLYLIRHAEKADGSPNTPLSAEGHERANRWAIYFKDISIDKIFSTPYLRTESTCQPTAISKQKKIIYYDPKEMDLKQLIAENPGKIILIIGHSNTIPRQLNQLLDEEKYLEIPESEFGHLYIIKADKGSISHTLVKI